MCEKSSVDEHAFSDVLLMLQSLFDCCLSLVATGISFLTKSKVDDMGTFTSLSFPARLFQWTGLGGGGIF